VGNWTLFTASLALGNGAWWRLFRFRAGQMFQKGLAGFCTGSTCILKRSPNNACCYGASLDLALGSKGNPFDTQAIQAGLGPVGESRVYPQRERPGNRSLRSKRANNVRYHTTLSEAAQVQPRQPRPDQISAIRLIYLATSVLPPILVGKLHMFSNSRTDP
jgi:hypothetical protein